MDSKVASREITVTDTARTLARSIVYPEVPRLAEPAVGLMRLTTIGVLPPMIRDGYGFAWDSRNEAMLRRSAELVRRLRPLTPPIIRYWPAARLAYRVASRSRCPVLVFRGRRMSDAFADGSATGQPDQRHRSTMC